MGVDICYDLYQLGHALSDDVNIYRPCDPHPVTQSMCGVFHKHVLFVNYKFPAEKKYVSHEERICH